MDWKSLLATCIVSVGGAGAVFTFFIKLAIDRITDKLNRKYQQSLDMQLKEYEQILEQKTKKYELKLEKEREKYAQLLNKDLEQYKSRLGNKQYISKVRFDKEFEVFDNLSKVFTELVKTVCVMIPYGYYEVPADKDEREEQEKQNYLNCNNAYVKAQDYLSGCEAFIPEYLFDQYKNILKNCSLQLFAFTARYNKSDLRPIEEKKILRREDYNLSKTIQEDFRKLNHDLREYLSSLEVIS